VKFHKADGINKDYNAANKARFIENKVNENYSPKVITELIKKG